MFEVHGKYTTAKVYADKLDGSCIAQVNEMVNHVAFDQPVAIMPDAHAGKGSVVGFTMPLGGKIVPNVIGVDIGCGMTYANLGTGVLGQLEFRSLDMDIRAAVPFGFRIHSKSTLERYPEYEFWNKVNAAWALFSSMYENEFGERCGLRVYSMDWLEDTVKRINCPHERAFNSLGTLGGGNHFIEFAKDEKNNLWVVIHSGSRKFGESVCRYWQQRAVTYHKEKLQALRAKEIQELKDQDKGSSISKRIAELQAQQPRQVKGLEWLETLEDKLGYMHDMIFAQQYASFNRYQMLRSVLDVMALGEPVYDECIHNLIDPRDLVIRKGAIRAAAGEPCLVPLNMAAGSLLGEGKSNPDWNFSAPHGAGRAMSRSQAKKKLNVEDFKEQMKKAGVWSSSVGRSTLDEAPGAYKPWEPIMRLVSDTMEISSRLKSVFNMKSS
jgi:tRNA-splicing ligase RtcB